MKLLFLISPLLLILFLFPINTQTLHHVDGTIMCEGDVGFLKNCIFYFFDTNNDTVIEWNEIEPALGNLNDDTKGAIKNFVPFMPGFRNPGDPLNMTLLSQYYFTNCDTDNDNVITMNDFTGPNATCLTEFNFGSSLICHHCILNGFMTPMAQYYEQMETENKKKFANYYFITIPLKPTHAFSYRYNTPYQKSNQESIHYQYLYLLINPVVLPQCYKHILDFLHNVIQMHTKW